MNSINGEGTSQRDDHGSTAHEEKIFVSVRLRPLNDKELAKNDVSDWECINNTTILYKNALSERSLFPTACAYDRVFGSESSTRQVYEEAAKRVALSVLSGINSSIFAYGQTSSGKTFTMSGITEYTLADIYDHIGRHDHRDFTLKFSALEIYNEVVRDLLSPDNTPLRLLDDPERGTVVERLTEITLKDWNHLKELLSICEAQRQIGETALNEMSSRSHQILRLTVESTAKKYFGSQNSSILTAAVNFVDLAGSERASQTLSANVRLKEGCHINRSLLTLGTVIRKLSKKGNGHVPYRDSKLTRILQNSLGGNARTAIICTMSPAHSHVEQSRNTLLFATCAKNVTTNAQVNVVMSEKALVKQLRSELARLEAELRNLSSLSASGGSSAALKDKEVQIEKMSREIRELTHQRDLAQSRIENLIGSRSWTEMSSVSSHDKAPWIDDYPASEVSEIADPFRSDGASVISPDRYERVNSNKLDEQISESLEDQFLSDDTSPRQFIDKYFGPEPCKGWENKVEKSVDATEEYCKEVQCVEVVISSDTCSSPQKGDQELGFINVDHEEPKQISNLDAEQSSYDTDCDSNNLPRSRSCEALVSNMPSSTESVIVKENGNITSESEEELCTIKNDLDEKHSQPEVDVDADTDQVLTKEPVVEEKLKLSGEDSEQICAEKHVEVAESDANLVQENEQISQTLEKPADDTGSDTELSPSRWPMEFETQRKEIIQLWSACNVPLIHRTYFFLLFKGDPTDSVYVEVELRRLAYLKNAFSLGARVVKDGQMFTQAASLKALNRERDMLSKLILEKFSTKERDALYQKWGIGLKTKRRRLQLCNKLWKDTKDMDHIKESAALVAKLVGFEEPNQLPKEMFELNFSPRPKHLRSSSWKPRKSFVI